MIVVNGADVPGPDYGEYNYVWSGSKLISERGPLSTGAGSTMHRTDYEYSGAGQLTKVIQASDTEGGPRGSTTYTYNSCGLVTSITDAGGHITSFEYDGLGRIVKTTYQDQTTDTVTYGTGALVHYPIRVKNRANVVTSLEYDPLKRLIKRTEASHTEPTPGNLVANTDVNQKNITDYTYGSNTNSRIVIQQITNGRKTMSQYDYRHRVIESKSWPYAGTMLSTKTNYVNNRVFYTEDAYGRREYMGYSVSNASELIRRVTTGPAGYAIANFPAVMDLNRLSAPAGVVAIADAIKDSNGNLKEVIDGRGIVTKYEYDTRDREIRRKDAFGTPVEAITETSYDAAGNVVEVRSPRYFDSSDPQKDYMKTLFTYTGRGAQKTQTVAPGGGSAEALTSQTYDLEGKVATSTDASGNVWTNDYSDDCCGHFSGRIDPLGHGSMTNMDAMGRAVHSATVKDYTTHTLKSDPDNAKTLAESTTRYDLLGRTRARTTWLTALGPIVKENPQIAGYDGVPLANGLTSQVYYDVNLKDGIGLDGTGGLTITKMTGSAPGETFTITSAQFAAVMNKLAEPIASGGAGLTFTANESAPSAVISVNAEDELSVSISDGMGRGVMTAQIQPWDGPQPFTLVTWSCQKARHDLQLGRSRQRAGIHLD